MSDKEIANLVYRKNSRSTRNAQMATRYGIADQLWAMNTNSHEFHKVGPNTQIAIIQAQNYDANPKDSGSLKDINDINHLRESILRAMDMDQMINKPSPKY